MVIKNSQKDEIKPIELKKNQVEENLKKSNSTDALAKAIKSLLNKENKN